MGQPSGPDPATLRAARDAAQECLFCECGTRNTIRLEAKGDFLNLATTYIAEALVRLDEVIARADPLLDRVTAQVCLRDPRTAGGKTAPSSHLLAIKLARRTAQRLTLVVWGLAKRRARESNRPWPPTPGFPLTQEWIRDQWTPSTTETLFQAVEALPEHDADQLIEEVEWEYLQASRRSSAGDPDRPEGAPPAPAAECPSRWAELLRWAQEQLSGKERRVLELLCCHDGEVPLEDLATDPRIGWEDPLSGGWNQLRLRVNEKLKRARLPWKLERRDNRARLAECARK
jgi:hypothetical protein